MLSSAQAGARVIERPAWAGPLWLLGTGPCRQDEGEGETSVGHMMVGPRVFGPCCARER